MDSLSLYSSHLRINAVQTTFRASRNGRSYYPPLSLLPFSLQKLKLSSNSSIVAAAAKKEDKGKSGKRKKEDKHSFVPRPDEATGPFPEAVLLKEKKVQEDGRLAPEFADVEERELFEALNLELESDMDVDRMRHYEVVYLIHEDHKEEVENVNAKVRDFLQEKKGKLWRFSDWGMRRLAYKINKAKNAHYILMNFEVEAKWINDFKNLLDRDERVIRHLVMKRDRAETEDCPPPPEFQALSADVDEGDEDYDEEWEGDDDEGEDDEDEGVIYVDGDEEDDRETSGALQDNNGSKKMAHKVGR